MAQETKLRFSAEDQVTPLMKRLRQESEQLGREMIRDARSYTTSGKEALRYIEDQIRAIERRNRLEKERSLSELSIARGSGGISEDKYKTRRESILTASKVDQQQVTLLRELIETVKSESRKEIIEDRKGVEQQIKASKSVEKLGISGDEKEALKRTLQRDQIRELRESEGIQPKTFDRAGAELMAQRIIGSVQRVIGSSNAYEAGVNTFGELARSIAVKFPVFGAFGEMATEYTAKQISSSQPYERSLAGISQLTGRRQQNYYGKFNRFVDIGISPDEAAGLTSQTMMARGGAGGSLNAAFDVGVLNKATGISSGTFLEQEKFTRAGGVGAMESTKKYIENLQRSGGIQGQDLSLLGEYLPILVNLQREQLAVTGEVKDGISRDLISSVMDLDDSFNNPDVLKNVLPNIMSGLRPGGTPQAQAYKYNVLSRMPEAQGKSFTELQEMMENPTPEYFEAMNKAMARDFGTGDTGIQMAKGIYKLQGQTKIARKIVSGEKLTKGEAEQINFLKRAGKDIGTGDVDISTAKFNKHFQETGVKLVDKMDNLAETMKDIFGETREGFKEMNATMKKAWEGDDSAIMALQTSNWSGFLRLAGAIAKLKNGKIFTGSE